MREYNQCVVTSGCTSHQIGLQLPVQVELSQLQWKLIIFSWPCFIRWICSLNPTSWFFHPSFPPLIKKKDAHTKLSPLFLSLTGFLSHRHIGISTIFTRLIAHKTWLSVSRADHFHSSVSITNCVYFLIFHSESWAKGRVCMCVEGCGCVHICMCTCSSLEKIKVYIHICFTKWTLKNIFR